MLIWMQHFWTAFLIMCVTHWESVVPQLELRAPDSLAALMLRSIREPRVEQRVYRRLWRLVLDVAVRCPPADLRTWREARGLDAALLRARREHNAVARRVRRRQHSGREWTTCARRSRRADHYRHNSKSRLRFGWLASVRVYVPHAMRRSSRLHFPRLLLRPLRRLARHQKNCWKHFCIVFTYCLISYSYLRLINYSTYENDLYWTMTV